MPARRTPNHLKVLKGTDRPDRMRPEPYHTVDDRPAPPDWLIGEDAVAEWEARVDDLVDFSVLTRPAVTLLAHYCNQHAAIVRKWREGEDPTAAEVTQLRLMATEFGFTPASRSKAGGRGPEEPNPFHEL